MRHFIVSSLTAACLLLPTTAFAVCNMAMPQSPENDCDNDGFTIGMGDCDDNDAQRKPGLPEVCDNKDNNCSGAIDEGNPGGGGNCNTGQQGVCAAGTLNCQSGSLVCVRNVAPSPEVCDGLDNNCAGGVDENITRVCYTGPAGSYTGTCPPTGNSVGNCSPRAVCHGVVQTCTGGAFPSCSAASPPGGQAFPTAETCNNQDDDCNGTVDNGNPGGGANCSTGQQGICAAGTTTCVSGSLSCVRNQNPGTETCNNLDDNCNGQTDEGITRICYTGPASSYTGTCPPTGNNTNCTPRGPCAGVTQSCSAGNFPLCDAAAAAGQTLPQTETCNNIDDDCNGTVDNGNPGGGGMCSTGQQGRCAAGTLTCQTGSLNCVRNQGPATETCNNVDDNCNGQTDENLTRVCYTGPAGSYTGVCPPPATNAPGNCAPRGRCAGVTQACSAGMYPVCDATASMGQTVPTAEVCNNLDDDCNGVLNNGVPDAGDACSTGQMGRCAQGALSCNAAGAYVCTAVQGPTNETCNGIDDNCNGFTDERAGNNSLPLQQTCYPFDAGQPGRGICVAGNQDCQAVPASGVATWGMCIGAIGPAAEICNNLSRDENCNGQVDEGYDQDGDGYRSCALCAGLMPCDCNDSDATIHPGAVEACDTIDQDCDGNPINVPARKCFVGPNVTPASYTGMCPFDPTCQPKGVCVAGTQVCTSGGIYGPCMGQVLPASSPDGGETVGIDGGNACNGLDDNCNGLIDDGDFDKDNDGVRVCQGDCNDDPDGGASINPFALEQCNGIDDNCDTVIDGVSTSCYTGPAGTLDAGICRPGTAQCQNGVPAGACMGQTLPGVEQCNRADDDCDGKIDEDFDLDGDGVASCALCPSLNPCDCNDDPDGGQFTKPGVAEICDCADNNCNAQIDEGQVCKGAPCHDFDFDGYTNCQGDCDDNDTLIGPHRTEVVGNNRDDDCDGALDEDTDEDGDKVSTGAGDCDDKSKDINPNAPERCDGFDNNCNGQVDEGFDKDGDFATVCAGDCNDEPANGGASQSPYLREVCGNNKDDNCDGRTDEDTDEDLDGVTTCQNDCNDHNPNVHAATMTVAAAAEICDGQDNDCNGQTDEGFDLDNDRVPVCFNDCDDTKASVNPNQYEVPGNGIDDNCNGLIDEGAADKDQDGFSGFCGDCNDSDPGINPHAAEVCDRVDNNCDGYVDSASGVFNLCATCFDADGDMQTNCEGDCNDADPSVKRGAPEICDGKDNDCEGSIDLDQNGFRVCTGDGGFEPDAGDDAGVDAGASGSGDDAGSGDGMSGERPVVTTGCGCNSNEALSGLWLVPALWVAARRRRHARATSPRGSTVASTTLLLLATLLLLGCQSSLTRPPPPEPPDAGDEADGGSKDAGFIPPVPNWDCGDLYPQEIITTMLPGTGYPFGVGTSFARTELPVATALVFDDGAADVAAFALRRQAPADTVAADGGITDPFAVQNVAVREIAGLDGLNGTPLVRERTERFSRTYVGPTYTSSQTFTFADKTNAFAVRNRLLATLSGKMPTELGSLPVAAGAAADTVMVVNVMYRIRADNLFIAVAVTPQPKFAANQPTMSDLTNGSHLGDFNAQLQYACEHRVAPALKSDFIFVVDNSGSMTEEQAALSAAAESLYNAFAQSGLNFRLGVVTTDGEVLRGRGFTTQLTQFQNDVRVGINGNGDEMGLEYALRAIRRAKDSALVEPPGLCLPNDSTCLHLRSDAGLVVVVLSDEEAVNLKPVSQYAIDFQNEKATLFAIVGPKPTGCARVGLGRARAGTSYIDVATATGGSSGSICNPNLLEIVEEVVIGALGAASQSPMANRPISGSLGVKTAMAVPRSRTSGFDYDPAGNTILFFGSVPPEGSLFDVAYSYFGTIQ